MGILEFLEHGMTSLFICGLIYLINLIAYLLAIHQANTLSISSSIMAALYFEKISQKILVNKFDIVEYLTNFMRNIVKKFISNEKRDYKGKIYNNNNDNFNDNENNFEEEEYEKLNNEISSNEKENDNVIYRKSDNSKEFNYSKGRNFEDKNIIRAGNRNSIDNDNEIFEDNNNIGNENYLSEDVNMDFLIKNKDRENPKERVKSNK